MGESNEIKMAIEINGMKEGIESAVAVAQDLVDMCRTMMEKDMEEKENRKTEETWEAEKAIAKREFARIGELLAKEVPGTDAYNRLAESLYKFRNILSFW